MLMLGEKGHMLASVANLAALGCVRFCFLTRVTRKIKFFGRTHKIRLFERTHKNT